MKSDICSSVLNGDVVLHKCLISSLPRSLIPNLSCHWKCAKPISMIWALFAAFILEMIEIQTKSDLEQEIPQGIEKLSE